MVVANVYLRDTLSQNSKEVCILCRITRKEPDKANRILAARARALRAVTETLPVKLGAASRTWNVAKATNRIPAAGRAASRVIKAAPGAAVGPVEWAAMMMKCSRFAVRINIF